MKKQIIFLSLTLKVGSILEGITCIVKEMLFQRTHLTSAIKLVPNVTCDIGFSVRCNYFAIALSVRVRNQIQKKTCLNNKKIYYHIFYLFELNSDVFSFMISVIGFCSVFFSLGCTALSLLRNLLIFTSLATM